MEPDYQPAFLPDFGGGGGAGYADSVRQQFVPLAGYAVADDLAGSFGDVSFRGSSGGEDCSGQCSVLFNVPSGAAEEFQLEAVGAEVGVLSLSGIVEWSFPDPQGRAVPEAGMVEGD